MRSRASTTRQVGCRRRGHRLPYTRPALDAGRGVLDESDVAALPRATQRAGDVRRPRGSHSRPRAPRPCWRPCRPARDRRRTQRRAPVGPTFMVHHRVAVFSAEPPGTRRRRGRPPAPPGAGGGRRWYRRPAPSAASQRASNGRSRSRCRRQSAAPCRQGSGRRSAPGPARRRRSPRRSSAASSASIGASRPAGGGRGSAAAAAPAAAARNKPSTSTQDVRRGDLRVSMSPPCLCLRQTEYAPLTTIVATVTRRHARRRASLAGGRRALSRRSRGRRRGPFTAGRRPADSELATITHAARQPARRGRRGRPSTGGRMRVASRLDRRQAVKRAALVTLALLALVALATLLAACGGVEGTYSLAEGDDREGLHAQARGRRLHPRRPQPAGRRRRRGQGHLHRRRRQTLTMGGEESEVGTIDGNKLVFEDVTWEK